MFSIKHYLSLVFLTFLEKMKIIEWLNMALLHSLNKNVNMRSEYFLFIYKKYFFKTINPENFKTINDN
jgi:hypothetical protein